eukprot:6110558-Pleurochrysis_carterae.AAC.1
MVTGGSGLVGKGIQANLEHDPPQNERWVFLTSKDGDLRSGSALLSKRTQCLPMWPKNEPWYDD